MKIYWIKAQAPRRVLALVKYLGIDAELIEMDVQGGMKTPEYIALNPNGKAPVLIDGDAILWESPAIMAYLCIKVGSDMWPVANPAEQVELLRWMSWNDCHWMEVVSPYYFEHVVKTTFGFGTADLAALEGKDTGFHRYAKVLDDHLAGKDFVACGRLTVVDFQLASAAAYWRAAGMPMQPYAHIIRWLDGLMQIPAWANPWPGQADRFLAA